MRGEGQRRVAATKTPGDRISSPYTGEHDASMVQSLASRIARIAVTPALVLAGGAALAQPAFAADFCVKPNTTCGGTLVDNLQSALDLAAVSPNSDRIFLGQAVYTPPVSTGFRYDRPDAPVEIIGAGETTSHITGQTGGSYAVLRLFGGPGSSVHDLSVDMPSNVAGGTTALWTNALARRVLVADNPLTNVNFRSGVALDGGTLEDSTVQMELHGQTSGVSFQSPGSTIRDSGVNARIGIYSSAGGTIDRTLIGGAEYGLLAARNTTTITSSLIYTYNPSAKGISAGVAAGYQTAIVADGVDIVGSNPGSVAVEAVTGAAPASNVSVTLKNSLIRNFAQTLSPSAYGSGRAEIAASYSDYNALNIKSGPNALIAEDHISNVGNVGFNGDEGWAPLAGSPLIDAGDPEEAQGLDFNGTPLVTDGDHDGVARRDIGAYELPGPLPGEGGAQPPAPADQPALPADQPGLPLAGPDPDRQAPLVAGFTSVHRSFAIDRARTTVSAGIFRGTRFRYTLSEAARVVVTIRRASTGKTVGKLIRTGKPGANSIRFSGRVGSKALKPGRYRAVITATDAAGNRSAPKSVRFRVVAG